MADGGEVEEGRGLHRNGILLGELCLELTSFHLLNSACHTGSSSWANLELEAVCEGLPCPACETRSEQPDESQGIFGCLGSTSSFRTLSKVFIGGGVRVPWHWVEWHR